MTARVIVHDSPGVGQRLAECTSPSAPPPLSTGGHLTKRADTLALQIGSAAARTCARVRPVPWWWWCIRTPRPRPSRTAKRSSALQFKLSNSPTYMAPQAYGYAYGAAIGDGRQCTWSIMIMIMITRALHVQTGARAARTRVCTACIGHGTTCNRARVFHTRLCGWWATCATWHCG